MPELPEVEVLVRHLAPLLQNKIVRNVRVRRPRVLAPTSARRLRKTLQGATFMGLTRRGKYLLFTLRPADSVQALLLVGHLGMTGRMYLASAQAPLAKHAAVVLNLGRENFVFEDTRYFGRFTLDDTAIGKLGPEPLGAAFTPEYLVRTLKHSAQAIKTKLLDQSLVAGIGNIYANETLFRAGIMPTLQARNLTLEQAKSLWAAIRKVLSEAVECGSTAPLSYSGRGAGDRFFYFGRAPETPDRDLERLQVYDRAGQPCVNCGHLIQRLVLASRSTYFCPRCQAAGREEDKPKAGPRGRAKPELVGTSC